MDRYHCTDYIVAQLVSSCAPWELRLDAHAIGEELPCNGAHMPRRAREHEAPKTPLGINRTAHMETLLGVEATFLTTNADDNAIIANQVVLNVSPYHQSTTYFVHPISHLVPSVESALAGRIRRIEDTLRDYFAAIGENPKTPLPTVTAVRDALSRLGAPMLFDHRRLQIPIHLRPGEMLSATLRCVHPMTLSAPVDLRFGFEWIKKRICF